MREFTEEQLAAFEDLQGHVKNMLHAQCADVSLAGDITQETFIAASRALDSYDPALGDFGAWLMGIARKISGTMMRKEASERNKVKLAFAEAAVGTSGFAVHEHLPEPEEEVFAIAPMERMAKVLGVLRVCVGEDYIFERSMVLMRDCEGSFARAAARCGVAERALRQSHRQLSELAYVIDRALHLHYEREEDKVGTPATLREVLGCFPTLSEKTDKTWMKTVPFAIVSSGGWTLPRGELVKEVAEATGYSVVTARHLVAQCERLFSVAKLVIESGAAIAEEV